MRYAHPSFVNKLNNNNRHARFFELVNTIPKHDVLFDECAINQNLRSKNFIFGITKSKFLPRAATQFALRYDMDISISHA